MEDKIKEILEDVKVGNTSINKGQERILDLFSIIPNFSKEEAELAIDSIETAIAINGWDNFNKEEYETPKAQQSWMYSLISKLKGE